MVVPFFYGNGDRKLIIFGVFFFNIRFFLNAFKQINLKICSKAIRDKRQILVEFKLSIKQGQLHAMLRTFLLGELYGMGCEGFNIIAQ